MVDEATEEEPPITPRDGAANGGGTEAFPMLRLFDGYDHTSPNLRPDVERLQRLLNEHGMRIELDGLFGRGTDAAVRHFQAECQLSDDGIVGALTWSRLLNTDPVLTTTFELDSPGLIRQLEQAEKYRDLVVDAAGRTSNDWVAPCVLAGIGSRESGWGLQLRPVGPTGTGDFTKRRFPSKFRTAALPPGNTGYGRGLLQIDFDAHEFARTGNWQDAAANIRYGAGVLNGMWKFMHDRTAIRGLGLLRASLAAYNCGGGNVVRALNANLDIDYYTTGRDYSVDVLNRAGWFQAHGWAGPVM
jgi:hypothetical protein